MGRTILLAGSALIVLVAATYGGPARALGQDSASCVRDGQNGFRTSGPKAFFQVSLTNSCPRSFVCTVNYNINTAYGTEIGQETLKLAPRDRLAPSTATRLVPIKGSVGSAVLAKTCS